MFVYNCQPVFQVNRRVDGCKGKGKRGKLTVGGGKKTADLVFFGSLNRALNNSISISSSTRCRQTKEFVNSLLLFSLQSLRDGRQRDPKGLHRRHGRAKVECVGAVLDPPELHDLLVVVLDLEVLGRLLRHAAAKVQLKHSEKISCELFYPCFGITTNFEIFRTILTVNQPRFAHL